MGSRIITIFEILIITTLFSMFSALGITTSTNDQIIENTEEFVELVRYKGCITQDWYHSFISGFDSPVDVRITVKRMPELATPDSLPTIEFTQDIVDAIDKPEGVYKMTPGDEIEVVVRKPSGSFYDNVMSTLSGGKAGSTDPAVAIKGGMILNSQYDGADI